MEIGIEVKKKKKNTVTWENKVKSLREGRALFS